MSKLVDLLQKALAKKQGIHHLENADTPIVEKKSGKKRTSVISKKPPTKSAGRGR